MKKRSSPKTKHEVFYGTEPSIPNITSDNYQLELMHSLNWYGTIPIKDRRSWFDDWAQNNGFDKMDIKNIPNEYLSTLSSLARLVLREFPIKSKDIQYLIDSTKSYISEFKPPEEKVSNKKLTFGDIDREILFGNFLSQYDNIIDTCVSTGKKQKVDIVNKYELKKSELSTAINYYQSELDELNSIDFSDFENGYKWTKPFGKKMIQLHEEIIEHIKLQMSITKPRKPRKKKLVSADKMVAKLNFKKEDKDLGIYSLPASSIIGADVLYLFNCKTRKLIRYIGKSGGFKVKGSTLQNFHDEDSTQKTIRKPEVLLKEFMPSTKVQNRKQFDAIKAVASNLTGRINKDCVVLKIY